MVARACGTRMYVHMGEASAMSRSVCANPDLGLAMGVVLLLLLPVDVVSAVLLGVVNLCGCEVACNGNGLRDESCCFDCWPIVFCCLRCNRVVVGRAKLGLRTKDGVDVVHGWT